MCFCVNSLQNAFLHFWAWMAHNFTFQNWLFQQVMLNQHNLGRPKWWVPLVITTLDIDLLGPEVPDLPPPDSWYERAVSAEHLARAGAGGTQTDSVSVDGCYCLYTCWARLVPFLGWISIAWVRKSRGTVISIQRGPVIKRLCGQKIWQSLKIQLWPVSEPG